MDTVIFCLSLSQTHVLPYGAHLPCVYSEPSAYIIHPCAALCEL